MLAWRPHSSLPTHRELNEPRSRSTPSHSPPSQAEATPRTPAAARAGGGWLNAAWGRVSRSARSESVRHHPEQVAVACGLFARCVDCLASLDFVKSEVVTLAQIPLKWLVACTEGLSVRPCCVPLLRALGTWSSHAFCLHTQPNSDPIRTPIAFKI